MLNDPTGPQSATRAPRIRALSNQKPIAGLCSLTIQSNSYYHADHFSVSFAINAGPVGWWDISPPYLLDLQFSLDGTAWTSLLIGEVDHQQVHLQTGLIEMEGRDLSARLIEAKTQEAFVNQTSSQIAQALATRHDMMTNIAATTTLVGRYYQQDHTNLTLGQFCRATTEWDLLTYLAQREGFDVYMTGNILNFQPAAPPNADPFIIQWTAPSPVPRMNAISLTMERSFTLAKDVQVEVRSWNGRQERSFTKTARAIGAKGSNASSSSGGKPTTTQKYVIVRPNLTEDQAQKLATETARQITQHERVLCVEMPGELTLTPRNMVKLQGTSTSFDQTYNIDTIERCISFDEGFRQTMRLKNSSPRTQAEV